MESVKWLQIRPLPFSCGARERSFKLTSPKPLSSRHCKRSSITRVGADYVDMFQYDVIPADITASHDVFGIPELAGKLSCMTGNTGVSITCKCFHFLPYKCYCFASISWGRNGTGDQLSLPYPLPLPKTPVRVVSPVKYRCYMNISYSMVWWDWDGWQRELDWMAMNGIYLPLSFTGQEYI